MASFCYDLATLDPTDRSGRETVPEIVVDAGAARASAGPPRPVLVILTGPQLGERMRLEGDAIEIGRDADADLVLRDPEVAWRHARVVPVRDGWMIHDLESAPRGVVVNGARVSRVLLAADDRIQLGDTVLRFELHDRVELAFDAAIEERISRDELTGLLSRRKFEMELGARLDAARVAGDRVGLAVLDLDRLKAINDRHGHLVGAQVISEVGRAIGGVIRAPALACRLGGDEFAVALPGATLEAIEALAASIRDAVGALRLVHEGERLEVGISAGVAVGPAQGAEPFSLLRAADEALLRAKRDGRGQVRR